MTTASKVSYNPNAHFDVKWRDVVYRNDGTQDWLARIYEPQGAGPFPAVIEVHGGAWANNDRLQNAPQDEELAASGIVVCAIDFRTSLNAPHPAAQEDINYATRWFKAHASEFNADASTLGTVGYSSGGHQNVLAAMRPQMYATIPLPEAPDVDATYAYVVMAWPVLDPLARYRLAQGKNNTDLMANHNRYFGNEAGMEEASPPAILKRGEHVTLPPALLLQGSADESLPRMMSEEFIELYSLGGGIIEAGKYPGEPHGFMRGDTANSKRAFEQMKAFIARQLSELAAAD